MAVFCSAPVSCTPGRSECGVPKGAGSGAGGLGSDHPSIDKVELWACVPRPSSFCGPGSPWEKATLEPLPPPGMDKNDTCCPSSHGGNGRCSQTSLTFRSSLIFLHAMQGPADPSHRLSPFLQRQTSQSPHGSVSPPPPPSWAASIHCSYLSLNVTPSGNLPFFPQSNHFLVTSAYSILHFPVIPLSHLSSSMGAIWAVVCVTSAPLPLGHKLSRTRDYVCFICSWVSMARYIITLSKHYIKVLNIK